MPCYAERTGQITLIDLHPTSLKVHEVGYDGWPLCDQAIRPWYGQADGAWTSQYHTMVFTEQGAGEVTCKRCERLDLQGAPRGHRQRTPNDWKGSALRRVREHIQSLRVGGRVGDEAVWVERRADADWVIHGYGGSRTTASTADLAAKLYITEVANGAVGE